MTIGIGCCVGSWNKFRMNVTGKANGRPVIAMSGQTSISIAYNKILDSFKDQGLDAVVLMHDDLEIVDHKWEKKILAAIEPDIALIGCIGGGPSMWWWNHDPIGHQFTDSRLIDFGTRSGDVDMIEGSFMVFTPWAIQELRFDERYEFLGYDDVCLHAKEMGKRVVVRNISTHHHSTIGFKSPAVEAMWKRSEVLFEQKWGKPCES